MTTTVAGYCTRCEPEVCAAAKNIYAPLSFVHLSLLFRLLIEPLCILGIILLTIAVYQTRTLHYNARLLLMCMTISVLVCNAGTFLDAAYKLLISFVLPAEIRCEYQVYNPRYFFAVRGVHIVGGVGFALSTMFLAVERALATITYVTYEQNDRRWVGIVMVVVQILMSVGSGMAIRVPPQFYPYVTPDTLNAKNTRFVGHIIYGLNIIALAIFTALYFVNRRRRRSLTDSQLRVLSTRFQLRENIATTRLMTPVMLVVALMTTSSQYIYYFYLPNVSEDTVVTSSVLEEISNYAPYAEYQISLMPIMSLMLIVLLPCFNTYIKRSFVRISHLGVCFPDKPLPVDSITVDEARDLYFEKLKGQWSESPVQRQA